MSGPQGPSVTRPGRAVSAVVGTAVVVLVALSVLAGAAGAAGAAARDTESTRAQRVLVFSLPYVSWSDLDRTAVPNLDRFVRGAAVAGLSTRVDARETPLGDGYLTIGAGTRAVSVVAAEGSGLMTDEPFGSAAAGDAYRQRTGRTPSGAIVETAIVRLVDRNDALHYDAEVGALADALRRAGIDRAVVANADGIEPDAAHTPTDPTPSPARQRSAVLGLMDGQGEVTNGQVDPSLLVADPDAPFGVRLDPVALDTAFRSAWRGRAVVLVEASDLVRAVRYAPYVDPAEHDRQMRAALRASDEIFGALLDSVDPRRDVVMVLGPAHVPGTVTLTPLAVRGPGFEPGLLRSASTRRAGFVQIQDVAPTILDAVAVARPASMEGRPADVGSTAGSSADRLADLRDADAAAQFRDARIGEVYLLLVVATAIAVVLGLAGAWWPPASRWRAPAELVARTTLGLIAAAFLVRLVPLHETGPGLFYVVLVAVALVIAAACGLAGRGRAVDRLLASLLVIVGVLAIDALRGAPLVLNSVLGYSPTVAGRFAGFGNPAYAAFSAAALGAAALLAHRIGGRRGVWVAGGVLAAATLIDIAPMWGADVGGILSMVPAYALAMVLIAGRRVRLRTVIGAVFAVAIVAVAAVLVDLARPAEDRTHLGRLVERARDNGIGEVWSIIARKLDANLATVGSSILGLVLLVAIAAGTWCWLRDRGRVLAVVTRVPEWRVANVAFVVLAVLGFALNDSGMTVPGIMLVVFVSAWVHLLVSVGDVGDAVPREELIDEMETIP